MPLAWVRLLDGLLGATDLIRLARGRSRSQTMEPHGIEGRMVGAVIGALREAFNRDRERVDVERERFEEERRRAERALRLELLRQAGDRELGRLRLLIGVAVAGMVGTLLLVSRFSGASTGARAALALGWLLLILALAAAFLAQTAVSRTLARADDRLAMSEVTDSVVGALVAWLIVGGLSAIALGALLA